MFMRLGHMSFHGWAEKKSLPAKPKTEIKEPQALN